MTGRRKKLRNQFHRRVSLFRGVEFRLRSRPGKIIEWCLSKPISRNPLQTQKRHAAGRSIATIPPTTNGEYFSGCEASLSICFRTRLCPSLFNGSKAFSDRPLMRVCKCADTPYLSFWFRPVRISMTINLPMGVGPPVPSGTTFSVAFVFKTGKLTSRLPELATAA